MSLIEKLDQPVAPDTQIKVFRLLHMPALNAETVHPQLLRGRGWRRPRRLAPGSSRPRGACRRGSP